METKSVVKGLLATVLVLLTVISSSCAFVSKFISPELVVQVLHDLYNEKEAGETMTFQLTITGGSPGYSVQWFKGAELVGTENPFVLDDLKVKDAGHYWAVVMDRSIPAKVTISERAQLVVNDGPRFIQPLRDDVADAGEPYSLEVKIAGGTQPYTVTWFFEDDPLPASPVNNRSVTRIYNLGILTLAKEGYYMVRVVDDDGKTAESSAYLTVRTEGSPLEIIQHPVSKTVLQGEQVNFEVITSGGLGKVTYQWTRNGVAIPGATEQTYTISRAKETGLEPDEYRVVLEDDTGIPLVSDKAYLRVLAEPEVAGRWNVDITLTAVKKPYANYAGAHIVEVEQSKNAISASGIVEGIPVQLKVSLESINGEWVFSMKGAVLEIYTVELNQGFVQPHTAMPKVIWGGFLVNDPAGVAWVGTFNGNLP